MTNRILIITDGDRRPSEQDIPHEKIGVFHLQSNRLSCGPGKWIAPIFFDCWICFFSKTALPVKIPNSKVAVKRSGCGLGPSRPKGTSRVFKAISFLACHLTAEGVEGTTKTILPWNMTGAAYGLRLCRIVSGLPKLPKGRGWLNTGKMVVFKESA